MKYIQGTDSRTVCTSPYEIYYSVADRLADETFGGEIYPDYLGLSIESDLLRRARDLLRRLENPTIAVEVGTVLSIIHDTLSRMERLRVDLSYIPPLNGFVVDDGSVLLEWASDNYRIGFNIELNHEESGWFLVTNKSLGEITATGCICGIELNEMVTWLLYFMLITS